MRVEFPEAHKGEQYSRERGMNGGSGGGERDAADERARGREGRARPPGRGLEEGGVGRRSTRREGGPTAGAPAGDEHLYRAFFRDDTDGVLFATAGGEEVLNANPEACRILSRSRQELLSEGGATIFDSSTRA